MPKEYYGAPTTPTSDYLAHYGVKGMKWGVRKAKERNNIEGLEKHYNKAKKKYGRLVSKADIAQRANNAYAHRAISRGASVLTGIQGGLSGALLAKEGAKALPVAAFFTGPAAAVAGVSRLNYKLNKNKLTKKGHDKAVKKVKEWEKSMNEAFKGTPYEKGLKKNKFKDVYEITDVVKGSDGHYKEKTLAKISGAHLSSDYKGKDKQKFLKIAGSDPKAPITIKSERVPDGNGGYKKVPSMHINARTLTYKNNVTNKHHDPMSFNYNMYSLHRKRKQPKLPYYKMSTNAYRQYKYGPK